MDYKNLDRIGKLATESAIKRLNFTARQYKLSERVYIEGSDPRYLSRYTEAGFKTILGIHPLPEKNWLASLSVNVYKVAYYFYDITALAMPYGALNNPKYSDQAARSLSNVPIFLFHVPIDIDLFEALLKNSNVKAFLAGRDKSVYYFSMTACQ